MARSMYDPIKFEIEVEIDRKRSYKKKDEGKRGFRVTKIKQKSARKRKTSKKK